MKKLLSRTTLTLIALTIVGFAVMPEWVLAANIFDGPFTTVINNLVAVSLNQILQLTAWILAASGVLLSISINLTLHVGDFFKDAPALRGVWILVRNLSSIGIIFILLYTSILTIVGISSSGDIKKIVGKIIMAGLLINFSLFFVNIAIDASNLISLQFYRAIVPNSKTTYTVGSAFRDGGLSDVFMSSLKIPVIYANKSVLKDIDVFASISIATLGGVIMMITAAISFAAASLAFMYRTAVLLFIMALSPIYFVAMIFPQLEDKSKELEKLFTTQLFFMPTYLFLMYVALRFVGDDNFSKIFNIGATGADGAGTPMFIGTIIQYIIALMFINAPLLAAISMGVAGAKSVPSVNSVAGWFGKHTIGHGANKFDKFLENSPTFGKFANRTLMRDLRGVTTQKLANSKFGGSSSFKDTEKNNKEKKKKDRELDRLAELRKGIAHAETTTLAGNTDNKKIKDALDKLSTSEIAALDKDILTNEHIIPLLSSSVFTAIDKSEKKDGDKVAISAARNKALTDAVTDNRVVDIKEIMKNMSGSDLQKYLEDTMLSPSSPPRIPSDTLIEHIRATQLKDMDSMDANLRKIIGTGIRDWGTNPSRFGAAHPAEGFVNNNSNTSIWT